VKSRNPKKEGFSFEDKKFNICFNSIDDDRLSQKFAKDMQNEFEMSLLGELSFFLGLQIRQRNQ
jgi:hypothetical protein